MRYALNQLRDSSRFEPPSLEPFLFHQSLPGYRATPLIWAPGVAEQLGVARVWVKDESFRLGLPSFKILGASWAAYRTITKLLDVPREPLIPLTSLRELLRGAGQLELVAATDGNHGRAVARIAAWLGLDAHILVPDDMVPARRNSIASEGARMTIVHGTYDDAVACSARLADECHVVISDTAWEGYNDIPSWVIDGYATIGFEISHQLAERGIGPPTVLAAQIGVGAFAAAVIRYARTSLSDALVLGIEPVGADCVFESIEAGRLVEVRGPHRSIMSGLNCGKASPVAWPVISRGLDALVAIDDADARRAMRLLANDGIVSGESGAAGLAGLLIAAKHLNLTPSDSVLVVSTEGATDPAAYSRIIGR